MDNLPNPLTLFDEKVAMPNLETMTLSSINAVKLWDDILVPSCIQNLTHLTVDRCDGLRYLFSSPVVISLEKLRYLKITNCQMMEDIFVLNREWVNLQSGLNPITWEEVKFPSLETLVVSHMDKLKSIYQDELTPDPFPKLIKMEISFCPKLLSVFPSYVLKNLCHMETLVICDCAALEVVFETQGLKNVAMELLQLQVLYIRDCGVESIVANSEMVEEDPRFVFPKLTSLTFWCLKKLKSFYHGIHTLDCPSLKKLDVYHCNELEMFKSKSQNLQEVVPFHDQPLFSSVKVAMANLETMKLSSISTTNLWDDISDIQNLIHLTIDSCGGLKYLFSVSVVITLTKLQYLKITNCQVMEDIFVQDGELDNPQSTMKPLTWEEVKFPNLVTLVVSHMDNLKSIYHGEGSSIPFPRLSKMAISFCQKLLSVFPSYVLNNLCHLETLVISDCEAMEVVFQTQGLKNVAMELLQLQVLDIRDCGVESIVANSEMVEEDPRFVFPKLTSLTFWRLKKLKSFYHGIHTLACPSLKKLDVYHCNDLEMFKSKSQNFQEVVPFHGQPLFSSVKDIPKMEELSLNSYDVTSICNAEHCDDDLYDIKTLSLRCFHDKLDRFPMGFLQSLTNLENLKVSCSSFTEIFSSENVGTIMKLKTLTLHRLDELEYLCKGKSEIQPILPNIKTLQVHWCSRLTIVVQSSSSQLFQNLDKLWVTNCSGLVNIMTLSVARSLVRLKHLGIYDCEMVEEIVASKDDNDGGEIAFKKLEHLELGNLQRLTSFCKENFTFKFPLLETLYVAECPKMETFSHGILSAPKLKKVLLAYPEWRWEGEVNATIRKLFNEEESGSLLGNIFNEQ